MIYENNPSMRDEQGDETCPSGCISVEACVHAGLIAAFATNAQRLSELTSDKGAIATTKLVHGSIDPICNQAELSEALRQRLCALCLLACKELTD